MARSPEDLPPAELARLAEGTDELPAVDIDAMLGEVRGRVAQAGRSPSWWLRARTTIVRRAIGILAFTALAVVGIVALPRPDMGVYPMERMVPTLVALFALIVIAIAVALRPLHVPALGRAKAWALIGVALVATLVVTGLPPAHVAHPASLGGTGDALLARAAPCFYFGLLIGLPIYAIVRVLDRGNVLSAVLGGAAAGLTGNFMLQLHCPLTATEHTLAGHFTVAVVFVSGMALVEVVERRLRRGRY